jgi:hypothetical protein
METVLWFLYGMILFLSPLALMLLTKIVRKPEPYKRSVPIVLMLLVVAIDIPLLKDFWAWGVCGLVLGIVVRIGFDLASVYFAARQSNTHRRHRGFMD